MTWTLVLTFGLPTMCVAVALVAAAHRTGVAGCAVCAAVLIATVAAAATCTVTGRFPDVDLATLTEVTSR